MTAEPETLEGELVRITFRNPDNDYTIARLQTSEANTEVTLVGHLTGIGPGERLRVTGSWVQHPRFGQQFKTENYEVLLPDSKTAIRRYLASGIISGLGPKMAGRIVAAFGEKSLEIIEENPQKLLTVEGIGPKLFKQIQAAWSQHHAHRRLMQLLSDNQIPASYAAILIRQYGVETMRILMEAPYQLALDFPRDGFSIADRLALGQGGGKEDRTRLVAMISHGLNQASFDGHTYCDAEALIEKLATAFEVSSTLLWEALRKEGETGGWHLEDDRRLFLLEQYWAEVTVCEKIKALSSLPVSIATTDIETAIAEVQARLHLKLSEEQRQVLAGVFDHFVSIVTGGPGTGKTTLIRSILTVYEKMGKTVDLTAPTGRAAKRLAEVTGRPAATIHRLLGYRPNDEEFEFNADNPLEAGVVILDEASMVDNLLMHHLLQAIALGSHFIIVGDAFQLPSVGPGNVLADLIASGRVPTFELKQIFRQADRSLIVENAHLVRQGKIPPLKPEKENDALCEFYFIERHKDQAVADTVKTLVTTKIPKAFGLDARYEIQVITPMHKGLPGTIHLNQMLQTALNPAAVEKDAPAGRFYVGDKVMHLKNDYTREVFNGDIGEVVSAAPIQLVVDYDGREVPYERNEFSELTLAYAISVHKSQGSEYPAVVIPLVKSHFPLLQRNLLYTALTRGRKLVIVVGSPGAFRQALENDRPRQRRTRLSERLGGGQDADSPPS